jgi:hypothetical protein
MQASLVGGEGLPQHDYLPKLYADIALRHKGQRRCGPCPFEVASIPSFRHFERGGMGLAVVRVSYVARVVLLTIAQQMGAKTYRVDTY